MIEENLIIKMGNSLHAVKVTDHVDVVCILQTACKRKEK